MYYAPKTKVQREWNIFEHHKMDFMLIVSPTQRIVIEIDGQQRYSEDSVTPGTQYKHYASPQHYATMMKAHREMSLAGYDVYRFGGRELWVKLDGIFAFFVKPDMEYLSHIDFKTLALLFCLMAVMTGSQKTGVFRMMAEKLLQRIHNIRSLTFILILLCFFLSMLTSIGNLQNLYLHGISGIGVGEFIMLMLPYTVVSFLLLSAWTVLRNKKTAIQIELESATHIPEKRKVAVYDLLFLLCLMTVGRIIDYRITRLIVIAVIDVMDYKIFARVD